MIIVTALMLGGSRREIIRVRITGCICTRIYVLYIPNSFFPLISLIRFARLFRLSPPFSLPSHAHSCVHIHITHARTLGLLYSRNVNYITFSKQIAF